MEERAIIVARGGEGEEVLGSLGGRIAEDLELEVAVCGVEGHGHRLDDDGRCRRGSDHGRRRGRGRAYAKAVLHSVSATITLSRQSSALIAAKAPADPFKRPCLTPGEQLASVPPSSSSISGLHHLKLPHVH